MSCCGGGGVMGGSMDMAMINDIMNGCPNPCCNLYKAMTDPCSQMLDRNVRRNVYGQVNCPSCPQQCPIPPRQCCVMSPCCYVVQVDAASHTTTHEDLELDLDHGPTGSWTLDNPDPYPFTYES